MSEEELKKEIIKVLREFKSECFHNSKDLTLTSESDIINHFKDFNKISSVFSKMSDVFGLIDELDVTQGKGLER